MDYIVVVDIRGTIYGMWHDDLIGLYEVEHGHCTIERASHVEWCSTCKGWHVWKPEAAQTGSCAFPALLMGPKAFGTRGEALEWEVSEINRRLSEDEL